MRPFVVVPTFNERPNLTPLLDALLRHAGLHVIVVDDASPDGTGQEADRLAAAAGGRVTVLHRAGPRGFGPSYVDGMRAALAAGATHVVQMDADFSHDPADVSRLVASCAPGAVVIGSRYVRGGAIHNWPWHRRTLSALANHYVRVVTGLRVQDGTSGFRCWARDLLARLPLADIRSDGYAFQVEMTWEAARAGATILEVPIAFVERREGASKMSARIILEAALLPWRLVRGGRAR